MKVLTHIRRPGEPFRSTMNAFICAGCSEVLPLDRVAREVKDNPGKGLYCAGCAQPVELPPTAHPAAWW